MTTGKLGFPPGPTPRFFPSLVEYRSWTILGGANVSSYDLFGFGVAVGLMFALQFIVNRTRFGTAMRAVSFDPQVAGQMGIRVNRIISGTFVLGSMFAAAPGTINGVSRYKIDPLLAPPTCD